MIVKMKENEWFHFHYEFVIIGMLNIKLEMISPRLQDWSNNFRTDTLTSGLLPNILELGGGEHLIVHICRQRPFKDRLPFFECWELNIGIQTSAIAITIAVMQMLECQCLNMPMFEHWLLVQTLAVCSASPEIIGVKVYHRQSDRQTNSLTPYTGVFGFFLSVKFATSLLTSLAGGLNILNDQVKFD